MERIENDCNGCDIPCISCGLKHVKHYYCDKCGAEETLYEYDDRQLCAECLLEHFDIVEGSEC